MYGWTPRLQSYLRYDDVRLNEMQQDEQRKYKGLLRRVRVTTVAV